MIRNVNQDFHFLEKIGNYVKLWKLLVLGDVDTNPVDPLPIRAGSDSGVPYEKPEDVPDGVATLEAFDKAWCIDGITARVLGWSCGGRSSVTYSSKSPKPVVSKDWLISTANGLYGIARGWDQSYDSVCSNGFCGAVESRDGKDIISRFSSWVPCGKSVSLEWNVSGRYASMTGLPGVRGEPPPAVNRWRSLPDFQDEEDLDNSSCVNWRKMFSAMLHEYAVRDFISVATLLGKEPDDDPEHGNFAWKDSDAFLDPFPMSLDSKHVIGLYSDLERCKMFVSRFPSGSSIISGSFSRSYNGSAAERDFKNDHGGRCYREGDWWNRTGTGCSVPRVGVGGNGPSDRTRRFSPSNTMSSVTPSGDLCGLDALSDEVLCPSWNHGDLTISDGSLSCEYSGRNSTSSFYYLTCMCYKGHEEEAWTASSSPSIEAVMSNEMRGSLRPSGAVTVDFSSLVPSGSFVKRAYIFAIGVSAKLSSSLDESDFSHRKGSSSYLVGSSGSLKFGVYAKLVECEVVNGNRIVIPAPGSASEVPDPSGEKVVILPDDGTPSTDQGGDCVTSEHSNSCNTSHKRILGYGPLVVEFDLKTLLKEDAG